MSPRIARIDYEIMCDRAEAAEAALKTSQENWEEIRIVLAAAEARCKRLEDAIAIKGGTEHAPTEDAYLAACRAIEKHRARIGRLETALRNLLFETKDALGVLDELAPEGNKLADQDVIKAARAALSDTAPQEMADEPRTYVNRRAIDMN